MTATQAPDRPGRPRRVDPERWPDIAHVPHSPVRAAIAKRLFRHAVKRLPLRVVEPDGKLVGRRHRAPTRCSASSGPDAFYHRLGETGTIGFGEAYMAGDWTTDDLPGVLSAFAANMRDMIPPALHKLRNAVLSVQPRHHDNTIEGARQNIHQHYDLSNDLFTLFLDETMTYSSAIFAGEPSGSPESARGRPAPQDRPAARLGRGRRRHPAARDRHRLGRAGHARRRPRRAGHHPDDLHRAGRARPASASPRPGSADRVTVLLQDYREAQGRYDAVVSVEMIEAVGANHWNTYFETIDRVLAPGRPGRAAGDPAGRLHRARHEGHLHLDPQVHLPRRAARVGRGDRAHAAQRTRRCGWPSGTASTGTTPRRCTAGACAFEERADEVDALGFDETFRRMWSLYLAYSEAGFRTGYLDVQQFTLTKP